jgi:5-(carboxyamino)imidazole ribonucleotide synthase
LTLGVLGAGQLGRMMALAGVPLELRCRFLDPSPESPARYMGEFLQGDFEGDQQCLDRFVAGVDRVTYEFENVPVQSARYLAERVPVYPPPQALEVAQDRVLEKNFFQKSGIAVPPFAPVSSLDELQAAVKEIGLPAVLKTRRMGYDGKGQFVLRSPEDVNEAWGRLGSVPLVLEGFVSFEREVSILAVRAVDGEVAFYPLVENVHREGILRLSRTVPGGMAPALQQTAETYAARIMNELDYVGVLAVEFFVHEGRLLANEMAPRVHNSGHWTIEGAATSQFENHLRAVMGWPLGATDCVLPSAMLNIIGTPPDRAAVLAVPGAHLHLYDKKPGAGRKLGHVTLCAPEVAELEQRLASLLPVVDSQASV